MVHTAISTINVGDWVEVRKPNKNRLPMIKNSRWLVQEVNPSKEAIKVTNGKEREDERTEHFYFNEVVLTSQFQKGDVVQHIEDPRYIGLVTKEGQQVKVKWADGSEDFVRPELINLFTRMVGGEQQIIGQYAFKEGDRVVADLANFEGLTFKVRECYPSGMVGVTEEKDGLDKSLPGCQLSVISRQSSVTSEEGTPQPPEPKDYQTFEEFNKVYDQWLDYVWDGDDDLAQVESQFTSARELWEQCYPEDESLEISSEHCEDLELEKISQAPETYAWIDPETIDLAAGTQTRLTENEDQIESHARKMRSGEWDWKREPLPELVWDGEKYYPVVGNHRIKGALLAPKLKIEDESDKTTVDLGNIQIYCRITPGTLADAKLKAVRSDSNNDHGVPESPKDFRRRAEMFLQILDGWDVETQIRELEQLKTQPYASEHLKGIDLLINRIRQGTSEGWSTRIIACYLRKTTNTQRTIGNLLAERKFYSIKSGLSQGDCIQFQVGGELQVGRISYLSATTITVITIAKTCVSISVSSPLELLKSIEKVSLLESIEDVEQEEESEGRGQEAGGTPQPPVKKSTGGDGVRSVSQELKGQAESLGLPTSPNQVLPDMSESDRVRNTSPYDVDDRPFATPQPLPTPDPKEYLIGFTSNIQNMSQPMIRVALEAVFEWMEANGQDQNLGYLKTVINDL